MAVGGYRYLFGIHMGICRGPVDEVAEIRIGDRTAWAAAPTGTPSFGGRVTNNTEFELDAYELFGGEDGEGGVKGKIQFLFGGPTQTATQELADLAVNASALANPDGTLNPTGVILGQVTLNNYNGGSWIRFMQDGTVRVNLATSANESVGFKSAGRWHMNTLTPAEAAEYEVMVTYVSGIGGPLGGAGSVSPNAVWMPLTSSQRFDVAVDIYQANSASRYRSTTAKVQFRKGALLSDEIKLVSQYIY